MIWLPPAMALLEAFVFKQPDQIIEVDVAI